MSRPLCYACAEKDARRAELFRKASVLLEEFNARPYDKPDPDRIAELERLLFVDIANELALGQSWMCEECRKPRRISVH